MVLESPSSFQHGGILSVFILYRTFEEHYVHTSKNGSFFFFFIKNLFLEMFIIKHPVLELLKTMLSKESPNLVNNFKASHDFLQIWVC